MVACGSCRRSMESLSVEQRRMCRGCRSHFGLAPPSFHEAIVTLLSEAQPRAAISLQDTRRVGQPAAPARVRRRGDAADGWVAGLPG